VSHQFYQLDPWLRMLEADACGRGLSGELKTVPAVFLIHCYNQGVGPTISALDAYPFSACTPLRPGKLSHPPELLFC
jgi:hypothetical protein